MSIGRPVQVALSRHGATAILELGTSHKGCGATAPADRQAPNPKAHGAAKPSACARGRTARRDPANQTRTLERRPTSAHDARLSALDAEIEEAEAIGQLNGLFWPKLGSAQEEP